MTQQSRAEAEASAAADDAAVIQLSRHEPEYPSGDQQVWATADDSRQARDLLALGGVRQVHPVADASRPELHPGQPPGSAFNASTYELVGYVRGGVETVITKQVVVAGPGSHTPDGSR